MSADGDRGTAGRDWAVIGLIGSAHACSHFYQLVLPPLFPFLKAEFGVSYTELGLLMSLFYGVSGCLQAPAGFVVDRIGASKVLIGGILLAAGAVTLFGLVPGYWMLLPLVALAGVGNSVFHPSDYTILSASVSERRLGRAYGVHTIGGNLGWAAATAFMLALTGLVGWRIALVAAGGVGLALAAALVAQRHRFRDHRRPAGHTRPPLPGMGLRQSATVLLNRPVLLCLAYFTLLSTAMTGVQTFLPSTLLGLRGTPVDVASAALTGFLLGASGGVVVGAALADRRVRPDLVVCVGLALAGCLILLVSAVALGPTMLVAVLAAAGFQLGLTTPSRDMMVRAAAPAGATGRVFGFVYSGLDIGGAVAPLVIGVLLDHHGARESLWATVALLTLAIGTILAMRRDRPAPVLRPAE
ncbi:MAG: MFS transporter [Rhodospirillaceae bacterium]|nr:MFS transporter [Rhodospirillaceae bacterium]